MSAVSLQLELGETMQIFFANLNVVQYYGIVSTEHLN